MTEIKRYCFGNNVPKRNDKSGPVVSYDDHAAIVAEKDARISELELMLQKNAVKDGNEIAALQEQVQKLAAESANLKSACGGDGIYVDCPGCSHSQYIESPDTPATDAALREIRAQAVESFLSIISHTKDMLYADSVKSSLSDYASAIRAGEQP